MLFTKVTIENYGVYGGINEFDFTCTPEKPIILVGGTNGSGKTTLFESILLCLYGKSNFDKRTTKKLYERFLENKMHREIKTNTKAKKSSIEINFKFHHIGKISDYSVNRSWTEEDGKILEEFTIKKDNVLLDTVDESQWQSFIEELIPKGISKLFFFDGEKIVKIAEAENTEIELKSSFDSLLGIDLVEQLQTDLKIYVLRKQGSNYSRIEEQINEIKKKKMQLEEQEDGCITILEDQNTRLDAVISEINEKEKNLSKLGAGYASKRSQLKKQRGDLEKELENIKSKISKEVQQTYPFTLIPNILDEIQVQITSEQLTLKQEIVNEVLKAKKFQIESLLNNAQFLEKSKLNLNHGKILNQKIAELLEYENISNSEKIFDFSLKDSANLISEINQIKKMSSLEDESKKYEYLNDELHKIDLAIVNAPQEDEIAPIVKDLTNLSKTQGKLESYIQQSEDKIALLSARSKIKDSEIRDLIDKQFKDEDKTKSVELAQKLDIILKLYVKKLRTKKIEKFEKLLLENIQTLMSKNKFISKISIDPHSFQITLYKENKDEILKSDLSKGEQQMLATAILWSLAKTSEKPLPFMIDTPLARLDVEHRENLIENFYPETSHQLVLFSTDSEIDANYYSKLFPNISKSYYLTFELEEGKSKVHSGYFWNENGERIIAV